jgi:hypothetical protein
MEKFLGAMVSSSCEQFFIWEAAYMLLEKPWINSGQLED